VKSTRREFCVTAVGGLSVAALAWGGSATVPKSDGLNVVEVDRGRVLRATGRYLRERPVTITSIGPNVALVANTITSLREIIGGPIRIIRRALYPTRRDDQSRQLRCTSPCLDSTQPANAGVDSGLVGHEKTGGMPSTPPATFAPGS